MTLSRAIVRHRCKESIAVALTGLLMGCICGLIFLGWIDAL